MTYKVLPLSLVVTLVAATTVADAQERIFIKAGRVLDVESGSTRENVAILVSGETIEAIGAALRPPQGARVIDLSDRTVLPGLIDSHAHVCLMPDYQDRSPVLTKTHAYRTLEALKGAQDALMAGFTTLRDLDNEGADMADIAVRDAIRMGLFVGPRLFVSGWALSITGGHMNLTGLPPEVDRRLDQLAIMTDSPGAMIAAIRDQVKTGVDFIKIYATGTVRHIDRKTLEPLPQLSVEEVELIVREAARWRMDVAAHAYGGEGAYNAVAGGVRSLEHGMFLDDRILDLMVEKGTFWVPTMSAYFPKEGTDPDEAAFLRRIVQEHRKTFGRAMAEGVRIAFGTDIGSIPHGAGFGELQLMVDYGMEPIDAIRAATLAGADLLRRQDEIGRLLPGYRADMIAVDGNPGSEIGALKTVDFVMVGGRVVKNH